MTGAILFSLNSADLLPNDYFTATKPTFIDVRNPRTEFDPAMVRRLQRAAGQKISQVNFIDVNDVTFKGYE